MTQILGSPPPRQEISNEFSVPRSSLAPTPAAVGIWRVNQQTEDPTLSFSLCFSTIFKLILKIKINESILLFQLLDFSDLGIIF